MAPSEGLVLWKPHEMAVYNSTSRHTNEYARLQRHVP